MEVGQAAEFLALERPSDELATQTSATRNDDPLDGLVTSLVSKLNITRQISDLNDRLQSMYMGTDITQYRKALKRDAEDKVEKISAERAKRSSFWDWDAFKSFFPNKNVVTETQEERDTRFVEYQRMLQETDHMGRSIPLEEDERTVPLTPKSKSSKAASEIIVLDDDDEETEATSKLDLVAVLKRASQQRTAQYEKLKQRSTKTHTSYIDTLRQEGRIEATAEIGADEFSYLVRRTPLNESEKARLNKYFGGTSDEEEVVCERFNAPLTKRCFRTLNFGRWMNDEMVNAFLDLCCLRGGDREDRPYLFSSFFLFKLVDPKQGYNYTEVQRWTARGTGKADLFARRAVIIPVNIANTHWVLTVVDMKFKRISYYDSMGGAGADTMAHVFRYLQDEHQAKKQQPLPDKDKWELVSPRRDIPQQNNSNDCGVFTCTVANFLMEYYLKHPEGPAPSEIFCYSFKDMGMIRLQMQLDILRNAVYPSPDGADGL